MLEEVKIEFVKDELDLVGQRASPQEMPRVDVSSIEVKKEDMGVSEIIFNDEIASNPGKPVTRNSKPENFLGDLSSIVDKSHDKSSFGMPPFPF